MKNTVMAFFLSALAAPGVALAHAGHARLAGLPDLLLHHPWATLLTLALGGAILRLIAVMHARARSRRR
ncbi:MAG: hypothetical protein ACSLFJ_05485 [Immundisolibacter sp.]|uniref:hypothetical protein n=1 Tax=Immundisolibacter sp. TaxID=1934948 RepID=UPI003EE2E461